MQLLTFRFRSSWLKGLQKREYMYTLMYILLQLKHLFSDNLLCLIYEKIKLKDNLGYEKPNFKPNYFQKVQKII
jgi:hypothetical protein